MRRFSRTRVRLTGPASLGPVGRLACWYRSSPGRRWSGSPRGPTAARIWPMSIVRINAIEVGPGKGDELAKRFAARVGAVDNAEGFEGFELLRPTDDRNRWLVV